jgi:lipoprotein NlpD
VRAPAPDAKPAVARPGYYIVKRGDTLYSIAHQYERDYREVAAWNKLTDPNVISAGQELRIVPPGQEPASATGDSTSENVTIVALPKSDALGATPLTTSKSGSSAVVAASADTGIAGTAPAGQKTEPKGGRLAYSAQAWKDAQAADKTVVATAPASVPAATGKAEAQSEPRTSESKPVAAGEEGINWIWPGSGKVLAGFNDSTNKGLDISGSIGDPVLAASGGQVVYVGSGLRGYGNLVIIKHNNNFLSAYAHNKEVLVKEKQTVQKGQKIALLGNSDSDKPMLHFEIRRQGKPVDPMKYLPPR